ncbi:MAG TPA: quinol:electron acceptor oxidoreductase subunit ActD [Holophagaceae bacterium]|nr:quinol:electron acceptor oxidoreductase subunit ActD [Holophagaceae bacterium]
MAITRMKALLRSLPRPRQNEVPDSGVLRADFADPDELLAAVRFIRSKGLKVYDTYTPFPVHGMDEALEEPASRLPWVTGIMGLLGCTGAAALQYWTSVVDYPVVIGGKPLNSVPAFLPLLFELTVLIGGLGTVATFLLLSRMRPRMRTRNLHKGANDDRFILVAELGRGTTFETLSLELRGMGALETERLIQDARIKPCRCHWERELPLPKALGIALVPPVLILGAGIALNRDFRHRVPEWDAGMLAPTAAQAYDPSPVLAHGQVIQAPLEGTVARGAERPLTFAPGEAEALRAGLELRSPLPADEANLARGKVVWNRTCATCHGDGAKGDGGVIPRFPNPPNLLVQKYCDYPEGRIFHVATFGGPQKIMKGLEDLIPAPDRWRAVMYLKTLQAEAVKARAAAPAPAAATVPAPAAAPSSPAPAPAPSPAALPGAKP